MTHFMEKTFDPKDWVKVRASTDGQQSFLTWKGSIYAVVPTEPQRHLFDMVGMSVARCLPNADGTWVLVSRELGYYLDPKTAEKIDRWQNPWTGEMVPVVHVANHLVQRDLKYQFPGIVTPDLTTFVVNLFANYPNPLGTDPQFLEYSPQPIYQATELFKFIISTADLYDPTVTSITPMTLTWDRVGPWLPWMKMGDRSGSLVYSAWGSKVINYTDLPPLLQTEINPHLTLYQDAPLQKLNQADMTSWLYFKQHFQAYLNGDSFPIAN